LYATFTVIERKIRNVSTKNSKKKSSIVSILNKQNVDISRQKMGFYAVKNPSKWILKGKKFSSSASK
jgi:hypothetical protein